MAHSKVRSSLFMSMCLGILALISACGSIANTSVQSPGVQSLTVSTHATPTATPTVPAMQVPLKQQSVYVASISGVVTSLNASSGTIRWNYTSQGKLNVVSEPHNGDLGTPLALSNGILYIASKVGIEAINARSGSMLWQDKAGLVQAVPIVNNGVVYTDSTESLLALNAQTGKVLWSQKGSPPYEVVSVSDGVVYANMFDTFGAFNASTGNLIWQRKLTTEQFWDVTNDMVYFITNARTGGTTALNAHNGSLLWKSSKTVFGAASNIVYTMGKDYYLYALNGKDGSVIWQSKESFFLHASPMLIDSVIYVTTARDEVIALKPEDGSQLWTSSAFKGAIFLNGEGNGTVYVFYEENNQISAGRMLALNSRNGSVVWNTRIGYTTERLLLAAVTNRAACTTSIDLGVDNSIALFTTDGQLRWHYSSIGQFPGAVLG